MYGTGVFQFNYPTANTVQHYDGGGAAPTATASDSAIHAIQIINTSPTGSFYIDGSSTSFGANDPGGAGIDANAFGIGDRGACVNNIPMTGNFFELGIWAADKSANNAIINSNQHAQWNF